MLPLEVGQPEDDVVRVCDGHAEALQEQAQEVGPSTPVRIDGRVV